MRYLTTIILVLLACGLLGSTCRQTHPVVIVPDDTDKCGAACSHLRDLGCPEGSPLEDETSCEQFCVETQYSGHALNVTCVLTIKNCKELDTKCGKSRAILNDNRNFPD